MRSSDWSSDVCSSDLDPVFRFGRGEPAAVEVEPAVPPRIRGARADLLRQVHAAEAGELARGFDRLVGDDLAGHQRTALGAAVAPQAGQLAGVDFGNGDDAPRAPPTRQRNLARQSVVKGSGAQGRDDHGGSWIIT